VFSVSSQETSFNKIACSCLGSKVNITLATDIVDKELKALRNARWEQAFSEQATNDTAAKAVKRKATTVLDSVLRKNVSELRCQHKASLLI